MRQALRKTLSALLVLTLILLVAPALSGHTASADTLIDKAMVTGIDAPVAGAKPDYTASISYSVNMMKFQDLNSTYYKNAIGWHDDTTGEMIKTTDTFVEGHKYTVYVALDAKSGYVFSTNGSTVQSKGYVNGNTSSTYFYTNTRIHVRYTFPKAEKLKISSVTITGVTAPKVGKTPTFSATVSGSGFTKISTSGWYINGVGWKDQTAGTMMNSTDKFVAGHTYRVIVSLKPDASHTFGSGSSYSPGTINGNTVNGVTFWSDGTVGYYYDFAPEGVVSAVYITGIDAPAVGKKPDYSCSYGPSDKVTYDTWSSDTWKNGVIWFDMTAGGSSISTDATFIEGHVYKVRFSLYTKTGYSFCDSAGNVATKGTINGNAAEPYKYSATNVAFDYTFPAVDKTVKTAAVTNLDAPAIGKTPDYSASLTATGAVIENYNSTNWKNGVYWYNVTDDKAMAFTDKFEAGKVYRVSVSLVLDSGYTFLDGSSNVVTKGTVNGNNAEITQYSTANIGVTYTFPELKATISSVTITGVDAPATGKTPDYDVSVSATGATKEVYNSDYWKNGVYWYDDTADKALKPADKFEAGHQYTVTVSMISSDGYTFLNDGGAVVTTGKINGNAATMYKYTSTNVGVKYTFPALAQPVKGAAITGIDAPAAGKKPDYSASASGTGYNLESDYTSSTMWLNGVEWYDKTASSWLDASTGTFTAGHQYMVVVSLKAKSGYFFDSTSTATINGKTAVLYEVWSSDNAGFSYTFDALPAADKLISAVTITGVTEPKIGQSPSYAATASGTGYSIEDYNGDTWVHGVYWFDMTTDSAIKPTDKFLEGHQYKVILSLLPATGYTFKNDSGEIVTPGTINGKPASETYAYSDGTVAYRYVFPKLTGDYIIGPDYCGIANVDGVLYIIKNGKIDTGATGLTLDKAHPSDWYYCLEGRVLTDVTSLVPYEGFWFFVVNGRLDTTYVGIVPFDGSMFVVASGRVMTEVNGLIQDPNGTAWYYCANGQVQTAYTGLAYYDGAWFYVINGKLAEDFTGDVMYDGSMFHVDHGMLVA